MKRKRNKRFKLAAWALGSLVVALAAYFGIRELRATTGYSDIEQDQGQVYYEFFTVLDRYTIENGDLPASLEELRAGYDQLEGPTEGWPDEGERFASVIRPDFSVTPARDNLDRFAPAYAERSYWARSHCEALWQLILKNCGYLP